MRLTLAALTAALLFGVLPLGAPASAPTASAQPDSPPRMDVNVTKVTPTVVTGQTDVVITGTITNRSDTPVDNVEARIERGEAISDESGAQDAVQGNSLRATRPNFVPLSDRLAPGEQARFELRTPLSGAPDSLAISNPGTYPLTINVNGKPSYGARARVAEADLLLPVMSTPTAPVVQQPRPLPTTLIVPVVDYPRVEGTEGSRPVLVDDQLGNSLSPGGRLAELVGAIADTVPPDSPLAPSLCFAIDPDLLATADAMAQGYKVRQPNRSTKDGTASAAARQWLDKLKQVTANRCVISLPYGDADVVALGRAGLPDLIEGSLDGADFVRAILKVEPRDEVVWPIDGALDEPAASHLADFGVNTVLMRPGALRKEGAALAPNRLTTKGSPLALPIDPLMANALDPVNAQNIEGANQSAMSPADNGALSVQNALGVLAYRATQPGAVPERISVLAPPRRWNLRGDDLRALLNGMRSMQDAGLVQSTALPSGSELDNAPQVDLAYPLVASTQEIQQPVLDQLARQNFKVGDLYRSSEEDPAADIQPGQVTTPLRDSLLLGASSAWRGNPAASRDWVAKGTRRVQDVLNAVQVDTITYPTVMLPASNSPIPVKVNNQLPMTVRVILHTPRTSGINIKNLGVLSVPQGGRSFWLNTEVQRTGRFTVDITATTEAGTKLGTSKRLQVESTNYDGFILSITIAAGVLLFVLSGLRIYRRIRARLRRSAEATGANDGDGKAD